MTQGGSRLSSEATSRNALGSSTVYGRPSRAWGRRVDQHSVGLVRMSETGRAVQSLASQSAQAGRTSWSCRPTYTGRPNSRRPTAAPLTVVQNHEFCLSVHAVRVTWAAGAHLGCSDGVRGPSCRRRGRRGLDAGEIEMAAGAVVVHGGAVGRRQPRSTSLVRSVTRPTSRVDGCRSRRPTACRPPKRGRGGHPALPYPPMCPCTRGQVTRGPYVVDPHAEMVRAGDGRSRRFSAGSW